MLFAAAVGGPEGGGEVVAVTPIQTILDKFKVTLVGQQCTASASAQPFDNLTPPLQISDAKRVSIEHVRKIKDAHGIELLRHHAEIAAIGIGAGDDSDSAALNVYLRTDTAQIRRAVESKLKGAKINWKRLGRMNAL